MSDWVNFQTLQATLAPELQQQADARAQQYAQHVAALRATTGRMGDEAGRQAAAGKFGGMGSIAGYGDLMRQRDAGLQSEQSRLARQSPWEALMQPKGQQETPWASLASRLGAENAKYAQQNATTQRRQTVEAQDKAAQEFARQQEAARKAANKPVEDAGAAYAKWSDAVQTKADNQTGASGASAYYDAQQGVKGAPQPVTQTQSAKWQALQRRLWQNQQNQVMPPSSSSNFGYSTSGF